MKMQTECIISGCSKLHHAKGYCHMHYQRWQSNGDPGNVNNIYPPRVYGSPEKRFIAKILKTDSCWLWQGQIIEQGYGRFWDGNNKAASHRFSYELFIGSIPIGLQIDHLCRNRACVNPDHLEAVTQTENTKRGLHGILTTNCPKGHPYDTANTIYQKDGHRRCRECKRIENRRRYTLSGPSEAAQPS